jgi:3-oxoacyl-[acyl-carrier protein] reductase
LPKNQVLTFGNRTAVVTGGSRNIGLAISKKLLFAGLNVAVISSNQESLNQAKRSLVEVGQSFETYQCDLKQFQEVDDTLGKVYHRFGSIDVLVNSAGVLETESIHTTSEENWDNTLDINLKAMFFSIQKAIPFLKQGDNPRIINISSNAGRMGGYANGAAYAASKGGVISMTYALARKLASDGITVNCVAPGTIESDMSNKIEENLRKTLLERFPLGRFGQPEEVAVAASFFASIEASFITGAVLDVNGGLFMG